MAKIDRPGCQFVRLSVCQYIFLPYATRVRSADANNSLMWAQVIYLKLSTEHRGCFGKLENCKMMLPREVSILISCINLITETVQWVKLHLIFSSCHWLYDLGILFLQLDGTFAINVSLDDQDRKLIIKLNRMATFLKFL